MYTNCHDNGAVANISMWVAGKKQGLARHLDRDGNLHWVTRYRDDKSLGRATDRPESQQRAPAGLCRPKVCDLNVEIGTVEWSAARQAGCWVGLPRLAGDGDGVIVLFVFPSR